MFRSLILFFCLSAVSCSGQLFTYSPSSSFEELMRNHERQIATARGRAYEREMTARHNEVWNDYSYECSRYALDAGVSQFILMAAIARDGSVIDVKVSPDIEEMTCFKNEFMKTRYPEHELGVFIAGFKILGMDKWVSSSH